MIEKAILIETRASLLLRLRDLQDAAAWRTFTQVYAPALYRYCRRCGLQEADAADVSQEVLVQVARSIRTFDYEPGRGQFRNWLGVVLKNKVLRFKERQARVVRATGGSSLQWFLQNVVAPDTQWNSIFTAQLVKVALERIRPNFDGVNWKAFKRVWLDDASATEVAQELNMAPTRVYVAKSRILRRLREEICMLAEDLPLPTPPNRSDLGD